MKFRYEKHLQEDVSLAVRKKYKNDVWFYHPREHEGGRKGILDCYICFFGLFVVIELKRDLEESQPTPLQRYNMMCIRRAGGYAIKSDNIESVMVMLESIRIKNKSGG